MPRPVRIHIVANGEIRFKSTTVRYRTLSGTIGRIVKKTSIVRTPIGDAPTIAGEKNMKYSDKVEGCECSLQQCMQRVELYVKPATLTVRQLAQYLNIPRSSAYLAIENGEIDSFMVGGRIAVPIKQLHLKYPLLADVDPWGIREPKRARERSTRPRHKNEAGR